MLLVLGKFPMRSVKERIPRHKVTSSRTSLFEFGLPVGLVRKHHRFHILNHRFVGLNRDWEEDEQPLKSPSHHRTAVAATHSTLLPLPSFTPPPPSREEEEEEEEESNKMTTNKQLSQKESDIKMMSAAEVHLGTKICNYQMERYNLTSSSDATMNVSLSGIHIVDLSETWEKLQKAARDIIASKNPQDIIASFPAGSLSSQDTEVTSTPVLSVLNPPSPEMELISDMRAQIQQLHQEMSLLRDSVKTCLDAKASLKQSVQGENPMKRKCCVRDETQVEAVLYMCGHMCTCLKCANELHWSEGQCPIYRTQIMDIVRVFFKQETEIKKKGS
ncbi:hypothetical protein Bca4012_082725 [Brassica carinata]